MNKAHLQMKQHLEERYPEIAFSLTFNTFAPYTLCQTQGNLNARREDIFLHSANGLQEELDEWKTALNLEGVEVLYVYGLGLGYYFECVKEWLNERRGRMLVFLEDDLGVIDAFLQTAGAEKLLKTSNVCVKFIESKHKWEDALEDLAIAFPTDRVQVTALKMYAEKKAHFLKKIQLKLYRNSAAISALLSDVLHSHKLFKNLYPNLKKLPDSFFANRFQDAFQNIPAVICGAGPSLEKAAPELKKMEHQAIIIAGGSAISALSHHNIIPHFCMALDPNPEEFDRLKPATTFEVPFLFASRLLKTIFQTCNGPFGYMKSDTGGLAEEWFEKKLEIEGGAIGPELGREAFSVTTLALAFAYHLGCNPIILTGVDLAFTGMHRYAKGVMEETKVQKHELDKDPRVTDKLIVKKDRHGKKVHTLIKWIMESECISNFAEMHQERTFINATEGGIGFAKIPYQPIEKIIRTYQGDLRGKIHAEIQKHKFNPNLKEKLEHESLQLITSLKKCLNIQTEMLEELNQKESFRETGKMVLLQMDLKEEIAYECFLQPIEFAIERLFSRYFPEENQEAVMLEREKTKWEELGVMIQSFLDSLIHTNSACYAECGD